LRLEVRDPIFELQLALLHTPQAQLIDAGVFRQTRYGFVKISMFFSQLGYQADNFTRIVTVNAHDTRIVQI